MQPAKVYYQADEKFAARALKKTHVNLVNNNNVQQALRCICDQRSHGWRSARIETECLVEGKTATAQCAMRETKKQSSRLLLKILSVLQLPHRKTK